MALLPLILDCDPGHDDALAIVAAAAHADLLGVTTVAGNAPLNATTRNAIIVLDLIGRSGTPVHSGAARPLDASAPRDCTCIAGTGRPSSSAESILRTGTEVLRDAAWRNNVLGHQLPGGHG